MKVQVFTWQVKQGAVAKVWPKARAYCLMRNACKQAVANRKRETQSVNIGANHSKTSSRPLPAKTPSDKERNHEVVLRRAV